MPPKKIETFHNITITPYKKIFEAGANALISSKGGPILPDWDKQVSARFCRNRIPVDTLPDTPTNIIDTISTPSVWCGPCYNHFGHQIADFSTRILQGLDSHPHANFLFATMLNSKIQTLDDTPAFFRDLLDWYGVPTSQTRIITQPTQVKILHIPPQSEQLKQDGISPSATYLKYLDKLAEDHLGTPKRTGTIFISRAGQPNCLAGETYLEELFPQVGIQTIRPESLRLKTQLSHYFQAEKLIFSEGSALHGLQLLGKIEAEVTVLLRRPNNLIAENLLKPRVSQLKYANLLAGNIYGTHPNGRPRQYHSIGIFDEDKLLAFLDSLDTRLKNSWSIYKYKQARNSDIVRWLKIEKERPEAQTTISRQTTAKLLNNHDLNHLLKLI